MYSKKGIQEITGMNWLKINEVLKAFRVKPDLNGLYSYDKMKYIEQCYNLKKDSGLKYSFIERMPMALIKDLIRLDEDIENKVKRKEKQQYDKLRQLNK